MSSRNRLTFPSFFDYLHRERPALKFLYHYRTLVSLVSFTTHIIQLSMNFGSIAPFGMKESNNTTHLPLGGRGYCSKYDYMPSTKRVSYMQDLGETQQFLFRVYWMQLFKMWWGEVWHDTLLPKKVWSDDSIVRDDARTIWHNFYYSIHYLSMCMYYPVSYPSLS